MAKSIKLRAKAKGSDVSVKALISHPMETGLRKDKKTGKTIPAHFIQEVSVSANDTEVMLAEWGPAVSKNPYLSFKYAGNKGDKIVLNWVDNTGKSDSAEVTAK